MILRTLLYDKLALLSLGFMTLVVVAALAGTAITPHDPYFQDVIASNEAPLAPSSNGRPPYLLGTDPLGRDIFSRLMIGARVSLAVGLASVLISGVLGTTLGLIAGYYRGRLDDVIMRAVDVQMGLPSLLVALFVLYVAGPGFVNIVLVLAVTRWMIYTRVTRSLMLSLRETTFVEAARAIGCGDPRIIFRHMLPNLLSPVTVLGTMEIASLMLTEAALDFLGLGIQPPESSWGLMLAQGRDYITSAWWLVTFPGLAILMTALALNVIAQWLRSVTDPVQRWRWQKSAATHRPGGPRHEPGLASPDERRGADSSLGGARAAEAAAPVSGGAPVQITPQ